MNPSESPVQEKGLKSNSLGLLAVIAIGVSTIAPAYAMTSSLGPTVLEVGKQVPAVLLLGFVPMFLVAMGYKELNDEMPDSGTSPVFATWNTTGRATPAETREPGSTEASVPSTVLVTESDGAAAV